MPINLIDEQVETIPNLSSNSNFSLGSWIDFALLDLPNTSYQAGLSLEAGYENFGAMGELFLDRHHSTFFPFANGTTDSTGSALISIQVPALATLIGRTVHAQALSGALASRRFTNLFTATILP